MALHIDRTEFTEAEYERFRERLRVELDRLDRLLREPGFGKGPPTMGAELELNLVNAEGRPLPFNRSLLQATDDPHVQLELDRFNLEYNLRPLHLRADAFRLLEERLTRAMTMLDTEAMGYGGRVVAIGILPTLERSDLLPWAMTDLPRYRALSAGIRRLRGGRPFRVRIDGPEPLDETCPDVTFEGANTSFQVHLRVEPERFVDTWNAAALATPLVVALSTNSPFFLGHRLWEETRIPLFEQSVDDRGPDASADAPARVSYGRGWLRGEMIDLFAQAVDHFAALIPILGEPDAPDTRVPSLETLRFHLGTVWSWNRPVYDPGDGGHLRLEMRALPAGPTARDMAANAALLVGLVLGLRDRVGEVSSQLPFALVEESFYRAARSGLDARIWWTGDEDGPPREVAVTDLAAELFPLAEAGLEEAGIEQQESAHFLGVVRERLARGVTGARWQQRALERLGEKYPPAEALCELVRLYLGNADSGRALDDWDEVG